MSIGRNEPCPCGSGKKYKKCCLKSGPDPINYTKQKLNRFHERIVEKLFRYGANVFGPEAFDEAVEEFFGWPEEEEVEGRDLDNHEAVFYPWLLFKWRIESADGESTLSGPMDQSIVQSFLQKHGRGLDPLEREYLEAFAKAPFSFFEITAVEPGKSVSLRDLLLERDYHVLEKSASGALHQGDVVFGSVVEAGGIGQFGALSMIAFKPAAKVDILAARKMLSQAGNGRTTADILEDYDKELRDLYFHLFVARTAMPVLCNTDGDKLSFHTLNYAISSPQKVFDALKGLTNGFAGEEDLLEEAEFDNNGELRKVEIPWLLPANAGHGGMENTIHGHVFIAGLKMTCEVNSAERAERLRGIIEQKLSAEEARYKTTVIQSAEAMMRNAPPSTAAAGEHEELMRNPEVRAKVAEIMRKHWEEWPDMALPALQGKTPREAVRDELGRQQVKALLEDAEQTFRSGNNGPLGELENRVMVRSELGLEKS